MTPRLRLVVVTAIAAMVPAALLAQRLDLSVSPNSVAFPAGDPDTTPTLVAPAVTVEYRVRQNLLGRWELTIVANGDLVAGAARIDISNVTWTATPAPPFQNGTLSKTVAQRVASGFSNVNPERSGTITFRLANSWNHSAGNYTQTVLFTLSAP